MVKACLNGGHGREAHPAVPLTAAELAADAVRCAALGVAAVHVHPRDEAGAESLRPAVVADALTAIRAARPGLPVGVSTGAWISPDPAARGRSRLTSGETVPSHLACRRPRLTAGWTALSRPDTSRPQHTSRSLSPPVRRDISAR
ncbi:3-keto-5-aminohexanoate cleavage protein [Micromonospora sp. NPDC050795]|uniref:3-keto-5-aminohexanoate cleavage protein n=1 Tax=Micromonospora sp. NPDC050795 TaxID=3364282 RepID=UPI003794731E